MKINTIHLLYLFISFALFMSLKNAEGNGTISGRVFDKTEKSAIAYASVFINGTTKGTITDTHGFFVLENVVLPCKLVISHIGFETKTSFLNSDISQNQLNIHLEKKEITLNEVQVINENRRQKNLEYFQKMFLGDDMWGDFAFLENDSVLRFYSKGDIVISGGKIKKSPEYFKAEASAPLSIQLPILGYELTLFLENFKVAYNQEENRCETTGYYYLTPVKIDRKFKKQKITKNRLKAYYNSRQHFLKSLYADSLEENGYRILKENHNKKLGISFYNDANIISSAQYKSDYIELYNMRDTSFLIAYYENNKGRPVNLNKYVTKASPYKSTLTILSDTCRIHKNGLVDNQALMFGLSIGNKRIGATLPSDFDP